MSSFQDSPNSTQWSSAGSPSRSVGISSPRNGPRLTVDQRLTRYLYEVEALVGRLQRARYMSVDRGAVAQSHRFWLREGFHPWESGGYHPVADRHHNAIEQELFTGEWRIGCPSLVPRGIRRVLRTWPIRLRKDVRGGFGATLQNAVERRLGFGYPAANPLRYRTMRGLQRIQYRAVDLLWGLGLPNLPMIDRSIRLPVRRHLPPTELSYDHKTLYMMHYPFRIRMSMRVLSAAPGYLFYGIRHLMSRFGRRSADGPHHSAAIQPPLLELHNRQARVALIRGMVDLCRSIPDGP